MEVPSRRPGPTRGRVEVSGRLHSILELDGGPEARVLADGEVAADAQELVLAEVVGDLVSEAEPAVGLGIEAVQDRRREEHVERPSRAAEIGPRLNLIAPGHRRVGDRAGDRLLRDLDDEAT